MTTQESTQVLSVTPIAANTIRVLMEQRGLGDYVLRVAVVGGGCSGLQYHMGFEENPEDFDHVIETGGIRLVVDPNSRFYLEGATIDFAEDLMGGGFRIENPNVVSSCGCGNSFQSKDRSPAPNPNACGNCGA